MIPSFDAGSMHDEEGRAFQQDRMAFFGKLGALFFLALAGSRVLAGRRSAEALRRINTSTGTPPTDSRLQPAPTAETDLMPAKIDPRRS